MNPYINHLTMRDERTPYFRVNKLGAGGYTDRWANQGRSPAPLSPILRQDRTARFHAIHHALTEYTSNWTGEAEIVRLGDDSLFSTPIGELR